MSRSIKHQFTFPQAPELVWKYLTEPELVAQWLMPNNIKAVVGHKFNFRTTPMPKFGFDGIVHCEVLELIPNEKLVYSWKGGNLDTIVTWTLGKNQGGTVLNLEHKGFKGLRNLLPYIIMGRGWGKIGQKIFKLLNS